jgi:hypothetical protein
MLPNVHLQALSSRVSDHSPLLVVGSETLQRFRGFHFEAFWPRLQNYNAVVAEAWNKQLSVANPFLRLHSKLQRTTRALRRWARGLIGNNKVLLRAAKQLIGILDVVQDYRKLTEQEIRQKQDVKLKFLGMTAVEKLRVRQASRLTSIKAAKANSKLFYLQANGTRRKNHIHSLLTAEGTCYTQEEKEKAIFDHFNAHFGPLEQRELALNWASLGLTRHDLSHLEAEFSFEEIHAVIKELAAEKSLGPDGYIRVFFKSSWNTVKQDIWLAVNFFYQMHEQHFSQLNTAHVVLLPKKPDARGILDFRPISLTHSIAKLISKLLANRLSSELNTIVSRAQSAFIQQRIIQDNFIYLEPNQDTTQKEAAGIVPQVGYCKGV